MYKLISDYNEKIYKLFIICVNEENKMNLERRMDVKAIVNKSGMSERPEFYSGRGATLSDLNSEILEKIYQEINHEYGEEASNNFVQMVSEIPKLSATDFLLTLYGLEANNWKYNKRILSNQKGIDVGPDMGDGVREFIGVNTIVSYMSGGNEMDKTYPIRSEFLESHGITQSLPRVFTPY